MRRALPLAVALALLLPAGAAARPVLTSAWCRPCDPGAAVTIAGRGFARRASVVFAGDTSTRRDDRTVAARFISSRRLSAVVPASATGGPVAVRSAGRISNPSRPLALAGASALPPAPPPRSVWDGQGMWVWELAKSAPSVPALVARARAAHVSVVYVKGADGRSVWRQLSSGLVDALHAGGLRVCAWQYTYGRHPEAEAAAAVASVRRSGADCFVIDAEVEYEGHYAAADRYVRALRGGLGKSFPVGVAGWPYADWHPSYPLSVFLGPGGAQASLPQVYWKAIGTTADRAMQHTWLANLPYGAPLYPIGQTYAGPRLTALDRFRGLTALFGSGGYSWWSWQATAPVQWTELSDPNGLAQAAAPAPLLLRRGAKGDVVIWLQEHLKPSSSALRVDGAFGPATAGALEAFQTAHGLPATGVADAATWAAVNSVTPAAPAWGATASARAAGRRGAEPASARLRTHRREIPVVGRGRP